MKKIELKINGRKEKIGGPSEKMQKVIDFIRAIPINEYFDREGLAARIECNVKLIGTDLIKAFPEEIEGHWVILPGAQSNKRCIYGSKASIAKLKKQLEIQ